MKLLSSSGLSGFCRGHLFTIMFQGLYSKYAKNPHLHMHHILQGGCHTYWLTGCISRTVHGDESHFESCDNWASFAVCTAATLHCICHSGTSSCTALIYFFNVYYCYTYFGPCDWLAPCRGLFPALWLLYTRSYLVSGEWVREAVIVTQMELPSNKTSSKSCAAMDKLFSGT